MGIGLGMGMGMGPGTGAGGISFVYGGMGMVGLGTYGTGGVCDFDAFGLYVSHGFRVIAYHVFL